MGTRELLLENSGWDKRRIFPLYLGQIVLILIFLTESSSRGIELKHQAVGLFQPGELVGEGQFGEPFELGPLVTPKALFLDIVFFSIHHPPRAVSALRCPRCPNRASIALWCRPSFLCVVRTPSSFLLILKQFITRALFLSSLNSPAGDRGVRLHPAGVFIAGGNLEERVGRR